jgi:RNA polymerase sigma-70 factor (ECF subfamily)
MRVSDGAGDLMARLCRGDERAAAEVHERFMQRLVALAWRQFEASVRARADHEDVVQSVFKSFFARCERGEFACETWDDIWHLLALITVRKCGRRRASLRAGRRDVARERGGVPASEEWPSSRTWEVPDREPTPAEAAVLAETLRRWLCGLDPRERAVTELGLQGCSTPEIARRLDRTERTVRRIHRHACEKLETLLASEPV